MNAGSVDDVSEESLASDFEAIRQRLLRAHDGRDGAEIRELGAEIRVIAGNLQAIRADRARWMAERAEAAERRQRFH